MVSSMPVWRNEVIEARAVHVGARQVRYRSRPVRPGIVRAIRLHECPPGNRKRSASLRCGTGC